MKTSDITTFLKARCESISDKNRELYKKIIESGGIEKFNGTDEFYISVIYPFENFIEGFVKSEISCSDDVVFLMLHGEFVEQHFINLFADHEGHAFSADKSSVIMESLLKFYRNGVKIEFDRSGKYTFHLPKKIFTTHDEIVAFYEALRSLFFGGGEEYIALMRSTYTSDEV